MITAAFFLPDLTVGGAQMVTVRLLRHLDRSKVRPVLVLLRKTGRLLEQVPHDVPVVDLGREKRLQLPRAAARLGPALREHAVDILLSEIEVPTLVSLVTRPLLPRNLVLGMIEHCIPTVILPPKTPLLPLYKRIYRRHDLVIAVSEVAAKDLRDHFGIKTVHVIHNPIEIAELAVDKQAQTLLMPVAARRQLNDLPDELWTKLNIEFYKDAADAVFKSLVE